MNKLEKLIDEFTNDEHWNTTCSDGTRRFDKEIKWIEEMITEYATFFKISVDEVVDKMESERTYSWPNYYQPSKFPSPSSFDKIVGIFKTFEEFRNYSADKFIGFKCENCGAVSSHPQLCIHRLNKDGVCNWCADGLINASSAVIILESGFGIIPIFEPVLKN